VQTSRICQSEKSNRTEAYSNSVRLCPKHPYSPFCPCSQSKTHHPAALKTDSIHCQTDCYTFASESLKNQKFAGLINSKTDKYLPVKLESWKTCPLSDLKFCKLFSGFGKLEIIKPDNLVI
jgi:hypothetical protein